MIEQNPFGIVYTGQGRSPSYADMFQSNSVYIGGLTGHDSIFRGAKKTSSTTLKTGYVPIGIIPTKDIDKAISNIEIKHALAEIEQQPICAQEDNFYKIQYLLNSFHVEHSSSVAKFLQRNLFLLELLIEASKKIKTYFENNVEMSLEVIADPENASSRQLYIFIHTQLETQDALLLLDKLDEDWWLDVAPKANGLMNISLGYL
jgi:hypothetical protein